MLEWKGRVQNVSMLMKTHSFGEEINEYNWTPLDKDCFTINGLINQLIKSNVIVLTPQAWT